MGAVWWRRVLVVALILVGGPAAAQQAPITVAAVYTVPVEQYWASRVHRALNAAQERGEIAYEFQESVPAADYERVLRDYAAAGKQLIIGDAFSVEEQARAVAAEYPATAFLMGSNGAPAGSNFAVFDAHIHESAYLTGMVAASLTRTRHIGLVGAYPLPGVNRLMNAFMAGAGEVNPELRFSVAFIDSWYDPDKARSTALDLINRGTDVLYAGIQGVADAAQEARVYAIGSLVDSQRRHLNTVIATAIWNAEPTIDHAIAAVRDGTFAAEDYGPFSLAANRGSGLAPMNAQLVPGPMLMQVLRRQNEIRNGSFAVPVDDSVPQSTD